MFATAFKREITDAQMWAVSIETSSLISLIFMRLNRLGSGCKHGGFLT